MPGCGLPAGAAHGIGVQTSCPDPVQVARRFAAGDLDEQAARRSIGQAVWMSPILPRVAGLEVAGRRHLFDEVLDALRDTMFRKVQTPPEDGGLDLAQVASRGEIDGWIGQLARRVVKTSARTARRARTRSGVTILTPVVDAESVTLTTGANHGDRPVDVEHRRRQDQLAASKPGAALQSCARWYTHDLGLPVLPHLTGSGAAALAEQVTADPLLAARLVRSLHDDPRSDPGATHPGLVAQLLGGYGRSHLGVLRGEPPLVPAVLLLASVSPRPRVPHAVTRTVKQLMTLAAPGDARWERMSRDLTGAYVESLADVPSESSPTQAGPRSGQAETAAHERLDELIAAVTAYPGAPLGRTRALVRRHLFRLLVRAEQVADARLAA